MALSRFAAFLSDPALVARFQRVCGVEYVPDIHTQNTDDHHHAPSSINGSVTSSLEGTTRGKTPPRQRQSNLPDNDDPASDNNNEYNNNDDKELDGDFVIVNRNGQTQNGYHYSLTHPRHRVPHWEERCDSQSQTNNNEAECDNHSSQKRHSSICKTGDTKAPDCNGQARGRSEERAEMEGQGRVVIRYPLLYYLARLGAFLGNEEFYLTGLPLMIWAVDSAMVRQVAVVWWLVMYVGQAGKDYLCWPRPSAPPVVRLETQYQYEFAMPSTHAMAGTAIPGLLAKLLLQRYQLPVMPVVAGASLWCVTTCLSRLYLGVHSILDLICGVAVALAINLVLSPLMGRYDLYQQTSLLAPVLLISTSLALVTVCYPIATSPKSNAKEDAVTITSVVVGVGLGSWLNYQLGYSVLTPAPQSLPVSWPSLFWAGATLLQLLVGVLMVAVVKVTVQGLTVRFFSALFGLDRVDGKHPSVLVAHKYVTYACLGLTISFLNPLLFTALGFGREGYYYEVM